MSYQHKIERHEASISTRFRSLLSEFLPRALVDRIYMTRHDLNQLYLRIASNRDRLLAAYRPVLDHHSMNIEIDWFLVTT